MLSNKKSIVFSVLLLASYLNSCMNGKEKEVSEVIGKFYASPKMFRDVDRALLSSELSGNVTKAMEFEIRDAEKVRDSQFPYDKPHLIEGDIFTSLYEGQDGFRIIDIKLNGSYATALVEFTNSVYNQKWNDKVILIYEKGWKIDNVVFQKGRSGTSTKDVLNAFLQLENRKPAH